MRVIRATSRQALDEIKIGQDIQVHARIEWYKGPRFKDSRIDDLTLTPYISGEPNPLTGDRYFRAITGWGTDIPIIDLECRVPSDSSRTIFLRICEHRLRLETMPWLHELKAAKEQQRPYPIRVRTWQRSLDIEIVPQKITLLQGPILHLFEGITADRHKHGGHLLVSILNKGIEDNPLYAEFDVTFDIPGIRGF